ncbi:putative glycoside hydrolase [Nocardia otitidiscaviarum]|uniref:putative glycoside hydrolase n=1 Tax=Nocardia otitidiscaviarum TaxID=1823 RepID=UPI002B4B277A|nr:putative glycoside hydrolase [Nocardia otitidiscaviarum]
MYGLLRRIPRAGRMRAAVVVAIAVVMIVVIALTAGALRGDPEGMALNGLPDGVVNAAALRELALVVDASGHDAEAVRLELDGKAVTGEVSSDTVVFRPGELADGPHTLTAEIPPGGPFGALRTGPGTTGTFTVDARPPSLEVSQPETVGSYREPVTLSGTVSGADSLTLDGRPVEVADDGTFELTLPNAPVGAALVAADAAGNETRQPITTRVEVPRIRAVHVTAHAWSHDGLREAVLDLAREGRIDTVQLDIKDEDGVVGYDSQVPLARESGAATTIYDAPTALRTLHDMGLRVVGRIVAFRDPTMAEWAWHNGRRDWVIQNGGGAPYSSHYGAIAFTNFAHPEIRRYNIDLAVEAARLGFDEVMYDYVRRPDGSLSSMAFPGLTENASVSIAEFLRESRTPVRDAGAYQSAAVFGIASTRPDQIAQDIRLMAPHVDYVAPMLYPSHWNPGEYGVANPNAQPYDIIFRSLEDFHRQVEGTNAKVIPWLQDFSLGVTYGDAEVRAQIEATAARGIDSFFLWNAASRYHGGAMDPS